MTTLPALLAILLYFGAAALMSLRAWQGRPYRENRTLLLGVGAVALGCHALFNIGTLFCDGGVDLGLFRVASVIAWMVALIGLLSSLRVPTDKLLIPVYGMAALALIFALAFAGDSNPRSFSPGVGVHILLSILAYSVLTIGACQALILGIQHHQLKSRHMHGLINALPPLQTMEHLLFFILWAGVILLTLSIVSGILFLDDVFAQHMVHKTFFAIVAWLIFILLLWGRHRLGWRGKTAIRWTLAGFGVLMMAYFGSKFVLETLLQRV